MGGLAVGDGVAVELPLGGITLPLVTLCFGKNAKTEISITATITTAMRHFAFLQIANDSSLKNPFFGSASRESSKEASQTKED